MNPAQARLEQALPAVLEKIRQTSGVYAALWCGSAARGEGNEFSDLDFHALVRSDEYWRSSFSVEGVQVEVFHNPPAKIRTRFAAGDSASVRMFAEGRAMLPHPDLTALMVEARALLETGRPPQPVDEFERFMLLEVVMDARAALDDPIHARLVMAALGPLVIRPLYAQRGWWDVKSQHWLGDLRARVPTLAALL